MIFRSFLFVFVVKLCFIEAFTPKRIVNTAQCIEGVNSPVTEWSLDFSHGVYPFNLVQTWIYVSEPQTCINVTFEVFDIENSVGCGKDFVTFYDGASTEAPILARLCGQLLKNSSWIYSSSKNALTMMFNSDDSGSNGRGFEAELVAYRCEQPLKSRLILKDWGNKVPLPRCLGGANRFSMTLASPGFNTGFYPKGVHRTNLIVAPNFSCIQWRLKTLEIEATPNCSKDYLAVYDGAILRSQDLKLRTCSSFHRLRHVLAPFQSSSNAIFLLFHSDNNSLGGRGFEAELTVVPCRRIISQHVLEEPITPATRLTVIYSANYSKPLCGKPILEPSDNSILPLKDADENHAALNAWPWHVAIRFRGLHICDGVLVSPQYILSVAHCLMLYVEHSTSLEISLGKHYNELNQVQEDEQRLSVETIILHPNYKRFYDYHSDLAIIRLAGSGTRMTSSVQPICLPNFINNGEDYPLPGSKCALTGFGKSFSSLRQLYTTTISRNDCEKVDPNLVPFLQNGLICSQSRQNCDFCRDGGALACKTNNTWFLSGILLWNQSMPCVHVRTGRHLNWIIKTTATSELLVKT